MFQIESEMSEPVARWLKSLGLMVKHEFVMPWGTCDLVGARFSGENVARRLSHRQTRAVGSITRSAILLRIPDVETEEWTTVHRLARACGPMLDTEAIGNETDRLVADRFVVRSARARLQKLNGWIPLQKRLVAVELKLSRIEEVMLQAVNNLVFASESFAAMPMDQARRVADRRNRWSHHFAQGVGLLGVVPDSCEVLIPARQNSSQVDKAVQFYSVEKFWRTRPRGS